MNQQTMRDSIFRPPSPRSIEDDLEYVTDPVVRHLTSSILSFAKHTDRATELLRKHLTDALDAYNCGQCKSGSSAQYIRRRGTLAPWQLRRAIDMLRSDLDGTVSLVCLADACALSVSHFNRAFKQTTGLPPHRWLMAERIRLAEAMLPDANLSLTSIAQQCGFSDQAGFTRSFKRWRGIPPGSYRRRMVA